MWVFGYGSLMWDGWEQQFGGNRLDRAVLRGYRRAFNKRSTENWGSRAAPGPTLGLETGPMFECIGTAFDFAEQDRTQIVDMLRGREGPSFALVELPVHLPDQREIHALTPVNDRNGRTYIGHQSLEARAAMARVARGTSGSCADYVRNIQARLASLGIVDAEVEQFMRLMT